MFWSMLPSQTRAYKIFLKHQASALSTTSYENINKHRFSYSTCVMHCQMQLWSTCLVLSNNSTIRVKKHERKLGQKDQHYRHVWLWFSNYNIILNVKSIITYALNQENLTMGTNKEIRVKEVQHHSGFNRTLNLNTWSFAKNLLKENQLP